MISVVIPTYNEEKNIESCLRSLTGQDYQGEFEIVVVDSSTDRTARIARKYGAKVIYTPKSTPGQARQLGFAQSKGEIIAALDADNRVDTNWLATIDRQFQKYPNVDFLIGFIRPLEGKIIDRLLLFLGNLANVICFYLLGQLLWVGTNQVIKRKVFEKIGGFRPLGLPFMHYDIFDQNWLFDNLKKEANIKFVPEMVVYFSMRRFHHFGYFTMFWYGLRAWFYLRLLRKFGWAEFSDVRSDSSRGNLFLDQMGFLIFCLLSVALLSPFLFILGIGLFLFHYFFVQSRTTVLKRSLVAFSVVLIFLFVISLFLWRSTSWAQENENWQKIKKALAFLKLDQRFRNLTDFEIWEKLDSFELQKLLQKADR